MPSTLGREFRVSIPRADVGPGDITNFFRKASPAKLGGELVGESLFALCGVPGNVPAEGRRAPVPAPSPCTSLLDCSANVTLLEADDCSAGSAGATSSAVLFGPSSTSQRAVRFVSSRVSRLFSGDLHKALAIVAAAIELWPAAEEGACCMASQLAAGLLRLCLRGGAAASRCMKRGLLAAAFD